MNRRYIMAAILITARLYSRMRYGSAAGEVLS